ncbi:MAG TPA: 23S rRNA (adenine(2503)-C(2))-methyltransferase RlmN [Gemmatimonadales bacterium]|jgi:23S rRNA (adenine2503-C2)-methyltransferase
MTPPVNLLDLTPALAAAALAQWATDTGEPAYRARQAMRRLWQSPVATWADATELPRPLAARLNEVFPLPRPALATRQESRDGTVKYLWRLGDGAAIESVLIPEGRRRTLCISSQAGCAFGCVFCATGRMGFQRHLAPWEITAQVRELALIPEPVRPTNIVFMGMGEPLHNWNGVDTALTILNDPAGFRLGARHITVSTVGVVPGLLKLAARPEQFRVALSLHAPTSDRRGPLMPVEKKYPLADVLTAMEQFPKRVTFEYVMIQGANDGPEDATQLARLAIRLGALVNLLPLHPGGGDGLMPTPPEKIQAFAKRLKELGVAATVRKSRGLDIKAACGQLRVEFERLGRVRTDEHAHVE